MVKFSKKKFRRSFKTSSSTLKFFVLFILLTLSFAIYQFLLSDILNSLWIEFPSAIINISEANVNIPEITISKSTINEVQAPIQAPNVSDSPPLEKALETDEKELGMSRDRILQLVEAGVATGIMAAVMIFIAGKSP